MRQYPRKISASIYTRTTHRTLCGNSPTHLIMGHSFLYKPVSDILSKSMIYFLYKIPSQLFLHGLLGIVDTVNI